MHTGITILICTYNGGQRLPATLRHIAAQQVIPGTCCELVIVDNASTDDTVAAIQREWNQYPNGMKLRILTEQTAGLTYARHTGITNAHYEYVILCDDDNWLAPDYVQKAFTVMEGNRGIGILGGQGHFVYETPVPAWLLACNLYAGGPQAVQSGLVKDYFVYGAGAVLRKSAYEQVCQKGFTPSLTDRQGHNLSSGGDYELCYVLALAGYSIWYEEALHFDHFIVANRLTLSYYLTYIVESSHCFSVLEPYKILLKTQRSSLLRFRWELLKSCWFHVKKICLLFLKQIFQGGQEPARTVHQLQYCILKQRIQSYRHFRAMENHFMEVVALRGKLSNSFYFAPGQQKKRGM